MKVLVDSTSWSLILRRIRPDPAVASVLESLIRDCRAAIFECLRDQLRGFPDTEITTADYEEAASFYNECQRHGIQGSHADFLICAVASRNDFSIFTTDKDFPRYAKILPITLYDS